MSEDFTVWYRDKQFSTDWTTRHLEGWAEHLAVRRQEPLRILEIGSWEGRSAVFFTHYFQNARLTCVDTFEGSPEHLTKEKWSSQLPFIEQRFDANLAEVVDRVEKLKGRSLPTLAGLIAAGRRFDVILIDGSHHSVDVLSDAVLSWALLEIGGVLIFDDYDWNFEADEVEKPKLAVDSFLHIHAGRYEELSRGYQLLVRKTA